VIEFENEQLERLKRKICRDLGFEMVGERLELYGVPIEPVKTAKGRK
jgi:Fur family ferric uptake transcriptional regulator